MTVIRITQHKSGVEKYLENAKKKGREMNRDELDLRVPLVGELDVFKTANQYAQKNKNWKKNYWHITISLPWKYHLVPTGVLREMTLEVIDFYFPAYNRKQLAAYAEIHYPKQQTKIDAITAEKSQRLPHVHLVVSKLDLWSNNQVRSLFYNKDASQAFQIWLDDRHNFESHYLHQKNREDASLPTANEAWKIIQSYQHKHLQHNKLSPDKAKYDIKKCVQTPLWKSYLEIDEQMKKSKCKKLRDDEASLLKWISTLPEFTSYQTRYSATNGLHMRLLSHLECVNNKDSLKEINQQANIRDVLSVAEQGFSLDVSAFEVVQVNHRDVAFDKRTGQSFSPLGISHEHLHMNIDESICWLKEIVANNLTDEARVKEEIRLN